MLSEFKKNLFLTAAAAASLLTVAPVFAANISLYHVRSITITKTVRSADFSPQHESGLIRENLRLSSICQSVIILKKVLLEEWKIRDLGSAGINMALCTIALVSKFQFSTQKMSIF